MPYAVLERKLQAVPEQYFDQVSSFLDIILSLPTKTLSSEKSLQDILFPDLRKVNSNIQMT